MRGRENLPPGELANTHERLPAPTLPVPSIRREIRLAALFALLTWCGCVLMIRVVTGRTWLDSLYHVVITLSSVGFGERSNVGPAEQLANVAMIVLGMTATGLTIGILLKALLEGEYQKYWGHRRMTAEIDSLSKHVIVCGYGRIGAMLTQQLAKRRVPLVVLEQDVVTLASATEAGFLTVLGNATNEEVLTRAGIERASTLVTALPSDAENVFISLTARNMNQDLRIIARGEAPETQKKLLQAGANRVILPAAIGAQRMAAMITKPSTLELLDLTADQDVLEVEIEEFQVGPKSELVGKTVRELLDPDQRGLLVVGIKNAAGKMEFNPAGDSQVRPQDTLIVMGKIVELQRFGIRAAG